jgi:glycerol-3-phosphate dehydrogenase
MSEARGVATDVYDVAVIGAGGIGSSAANHLAAAGFSTILLDKGDIAGATSGRTSRLQYCGLSYFWNFRSTVHAVLHPAQSVESLELARRAMRDRSRFVRETPERVKPVTFYFPLHRDLGIPTWKIRAGFRMLEMLDPGGVPLAVDLLSPEQARQDPLLRQLRGLDQLRGVLRYTEYQFDWPERICADAALHARDGGATIATYAPVVGLGRDRDKLWEITLADAVTGGERRVRAKSVVNAAGVWVDKLSAMAGAPRLNQGAKGVNVMVRLPAEFRGIGFESITRGGEPFYVIPWDDLHYFGPRNRPQDPTDDGFLVSEQEIADLIDEMNHHFPALRVARRDVLYSWAGTRPRTARPGFPAGSSASRLHDLSGVGAENLYVYTGGLLMTHRDAGRTVAAAVARRVAASRPARPVAYTARRFPEDHNTPAVSDHYPGVSISDLRFACAHEEVRHLDDVMFRRVRLGWSERMGADVAHHVAHSVRDIMQWSADEANAQATRYVADLRRSYGLDPARDTAAGAVA